MLEPKVRPIAGSTPLIQTVGADLIGLLICRQGPAPEDWENYLVLSLIAKERFLGQPGRRVGLR